MLLKWKAIMANAFTLIQKTLSSSSYLFPNLAGRAAFELFSTPINPKVSNSERMQQAQLVLNQANEFLTHSGKNEIKTYKWHASKRRREQSVLIVHGWTSRALYMTAFVNPLLEKGFDVIAIDLPAHGKSKGKQLKFRAAAQAIQDITAQHGPIYAMLGHSFGGAMISFALLGGQPLNKRISTERVVLVAAPNQLKGVTERFCKAFQLSEKAQIVFENQMTKLAQQDINTIASQNVYEELGLPVLLIHDEADLEVPFADSKGYEDLNNAKLVTTQGLGHRRILYDDTVVSHVTNFLTNTP